MHHEPSRVERKRDARTNAILDEAMRILTAEGIDGLTLGRLARSLDVVPAALYRYFDSKDALLSALQRRAIARIQARICGVLDELPRSSSLAKIFAVARVYLSLPRTEPQTYFLVALLVGDPRPLLSKEEGKATAPLLLALLGEVDALFREANETGALAKGDSFERTVAFWALLHGTLAVEKIRRIASGVPSANEIAMDALGAMLAGWGADVAAVRRARRS